MSEISVEQLQARLRAAADTTDEQSLIVQSCAAIEALQADRDALAARLAELEAEVSELTATNATLDDVLHEANNELERLAEMDRQTSIAATCNHVARMERAEAKLAELEWQEPVAWQHRNGALSCRCPEGQAGTYWVPLYARPAPAEQPVNARMLAALKVCRHKFSEYVEHHKAKGDTDKAVANETMVSLADVAIMSAEASLATPQLDADVAMTRDDVIRMAQEAEMTTALVISDLERFATLIAAAEREACALACEAVASDRWNLYKGRSPYTGKEEGRANPYVQGESSGAELCVDAIRARGQK